MSIIIHLKSMGLLPEHFDFHSFVCLCVTHKGQRVYRWLRLHSVLNNDDADFAMSVMFHERRPILTVNYLLLVILGCLASVSNQCDENSECKNGYCRAGMCICNPGWWGKLCQFCRLR